MVVMVGDIIVVPAAAFPIGGGRVVRHRFALGRNIEFRNSPTGQPLSAAEYTNSVTGPTLGELYQAFFGNIDGKPTCPAYRESVYAHLKKRKYSDRTRRGEYTSTWIYREPSKHGTRNNQEVLVIEKPQEVVLESDEWVAKGGKQYGMLLPPSGWILKFDPLTGFPVETTKDEDAIRKIYGKDTSYYNTGAHIRYGQGTGFGLAGLHPVIRKFGAASGPFNISTNQSPDTIDETIGIRQCYRAGEGLDMGSSEREKLMELLLVQHDLIGRLLRTGLKNSPGVTSG